MLIDKINALLSLKSSNITKFSKFAGTTQANISKKGKSNTLYLREAVQLAEFTNTRLSFIDNKTNKELISFDKDDITVL